VDRVKKNKKELLFFVSVENKRKLSVKMKIRNANEKSDC